jgi:AcrR family transcriptional regulator
VPDVQKRPYRSERRAGQAAATRSAILEAASGLFEEGGYTGTTTAAIAKRAGVSEATVFAAFGSKAGVLQALIGRAVVERDSGGSLAVTSEWSKAATSPHPEDALSDFAKVASEIQRRTWKLIELSRTASDTDPAMAELVKQGAANRRADCGAFLKAALVGHLRSGLRTAEAIDILWVYTSADMYRLLVGVAGWSHVRYTRWLAETLRSELLGSHGG